MSVVGKDASLPTTDMILIGAQPNLHNIRENKFDITVVLAKTSADGQKANSVPRDWMTSRDGILQFDYFIFNDIADE